MDESELIVSFCTMRTEGSACCVYRGSVLGKGPRYLHRGLAQLRMGTLWAWICFGSTGMGYIIVVAHECNCDGGRVDSLHDDACGT